MKKIFLVAILTFFLESLIGCGKSKAPQSGEPTNEDPPPTGEQTGNNTTNYFSDFRIGIYVAPPVRNTTKKDYQNIKDANVDFIQDISEDRSDADKTAMLQMAFQTGLSMIVADSRVHGGDDALRELIDLYGKYPATIGYFVVDEPRADELSAAGSIYNRILNIDPKTIPHVNLFPNYATGALSGVNYESGYLDKWVETVGASNLKYIAFDNYPYIKDNKGDNGTNYRWSDYYQNFDMVRKAGNKYNIKTSTYLQSIGSSGELRVPNQNELRLNAYSALAYGITIPVWFTYWTPNANFTPAIVNINGEKTALYEPFKEINFKMHNLGQYLVNLKAEEVFHTGEYIPYGTKRPTSELGIDVSDTKNDSTIITHFIDKKDGKKYFFIVNKSLTASKNISLNTSGIDKINRISKNTGKIEEDNLVSNNSFNDFFLPGEGNLYLIN